MAIDGDDAIRIHHGHREYIDLTILDVVMPGRNGKETLDEITSTDPSAKAIFVSGYTGDVVIDKGIHSESVDFLHKPLRGKPRVRALDSGQAYSKKGL